MTDVKNSRLYKTLKKAVRKEDHAELLRMLEMVEMPSQSEKSKRDWGWSWYGLDASNLLQAFPWSETPQGWGYWYELSSSLSRAGHDCY